MEVSAEQVQFFKDNGYLVIPGFMEQAKVEAVKSRLLDLIEGNHDWPDDFFQVLDPAKYKNARGGQLPFGVQGPSRREEVFAAIADHPRLQAAMSALIGGPVRRFTDQCICRNGAVLGGNS